MDKTNVDTFLSNNKSSVSLSDTKFATNFTILHILSSRLIMSDVRDTPLLLDPKSPLANRSEWNKISETFCQAYGCPKRHYENLWSTYPANDATMDISDCNLYARFLTDTIATKALYCPEMSMVAGNIVTFYTRWFVALQNEEFKGSQVKTRDKENRHNEPKHYYLNDVVKSLEGQYFQRKPAGRSCSYPRLYKQGFLTDEFMRAIESFGGLDAVEYLLDSESHLEYNFDFLAMRTARDVYMLRTPKGEPMETLGETFLRTALHLHNGERVRVLRTFSDLLHRRCIFATPVLVNSGLVCSENMSSCFLMGMPRTDGLNNLYTSIASIATCLENNGGVGLSLTHFNTRRYGGLMSVMKLINESVNMLRHNDSGRPGAVAIYLEPWHPDIVDFLDVRKNHGDERKRCRDLFTALWIPDIFMKRVYRDARWSLFDPESESGQELLTLHGTAFKQRYKQFEARGCYVAQVDARMLWTKVLKSQISTGTPYMLYKDSCIQKSVHRDLGPIRCSNLCTEVVQFSTNDKIATCKLASVCLPAFLDEVGKKKGEYQDEWTLRWALLEKVVENLVYSLNLMHSRSNAIKGEETGSASIGIGVQGLADVFFTLNTYWGSPLSKRINHEIFERLYYYAISASCRQARLSNKRFDNFEATFLSKGLLQFDQWVWSPMDAFCDCHLDWLTLKNEVIKYGLYNSLLIALMPTVTTSQVTGCNESFEPSFANIYLKRTRVGEFQMTNRYLVEVLRDKGKYDEETVNRIQQDDGSVRGLADILDEHQMRVFRTVWEVPTRVLIDMAADRAPFVDQSQSMSLYLANPDVDTLSELHFYGWAKGLKTGMYYLRTRPATNAIKFTLMPTDKRDGDYRKQQTQSLHASKEAYNKCARKDMLPQCDSCSA